MTQRKGRRSTAVGCLLIALLSLVLTWPLARDLGGAVEDRQDALLNVWITAWDGHQLLSDPLHLFDANIFHPYRRTLAYSELLLGNGLLALPVTAITGNPILGYDLALLLSFFLTALGMYLLVLKLTHSPGGGLVAGTILAFCSYRMTNFAQAQLLTTQWLPLTFLALHGLMRRPCPRYAILFTLFFGLQALSSFYYGMLLSLAVLLFITFVFAAWLVRCIRHRPVPAAPGRVALALLVTALACLLIVLPFALPYFRVQGELGFERSLADSEPFSASLSQYLSVPPRSLLLGRWLPAEETSQPGGYPVDALYPGLTALGLALAGISAGRWRTRWLYLALLLGSFVLSLGPRLYLAPGRPASLEIALPYAWLYAVAPGFKALRAPVRFDALVMLALAVLAGYGVAALARYFRSMASKRESTALSRRAPALATPLTGVCLLLVVLESAALPAARAESVPVGDAVPSSYRWLAVQPPTTILELPMAFTSGGPELEYQYFSTIHWQTTPDGYSGFIPPKHGQIVYEMERFPSERGVSLLQALGVEYVVIHTDRYPAGRREDMQAALAQAADLALVQVFGSDQIYRLRARTIAPDNLSVTAYLPQAVAGHPYTAYLIATNHGSRSYAIPPTHLLALAAAWEAPGASTSEAATADVPLVTSPEGGAAVVPLTLTAPSGSGTYHLLLAAQGGPLGSFSLEGDVTVGDAGTAPPVRFPVPARLVSGVVPVMVQPGSKLEVQLTWQTLGKIDAYYSVYVKLVDAAGNAVAGWDGQPQNGTAPTLLWVPGTTIADTVPLDIPFDLPPGDYTVVVGMYRAEDLARAMTLDAYGMPVDEVSLGTVRAGP